MERRKKANRNPKQVVEREAENESDSTDREDDSPEQLAKNRRNEEIITKKVEEVLNRIHPSTPQPEPPPRASTHNPKAAEIIPLFDPEISEITSGNWLSKIDQLGFIHGWDDEAKAFYMQAKLAGIARLWYNGLKEYNKTWDDWKQALLNAFPSHEYFIDNLKKLLARKKLSTSSSSYASPAVLVKKKTGDYRLCIDYRKLNAITIKDRYPLPHIEDQIGRLRGKKFFCSLDMTQGYYQIPVSPSSVHKTAFVTQEGQFEFLRMPFGFSNAPATFQRALNNLFTSFRDNKIIIYLDDILIASETISDGLTTLNVVLQKLQSANLKLNLEKCYFF
jgi:hypothetical protein